MKPYASKNAKLLKQYPFLNDILLLRLEPLGKDNNLNIDELTIKVQKADGDLMFRKADNVGLGDNSFICQVSGARKGQVMRRGEYLFAIGENNKCLKRLDWPRNSEERRVLDWEVYGKFALWETELSNGHLMNPLWNKTKCLVWVTVEAWHKDSRKDDGPESRFGEFVERTIQLTVYGKPECGFEKLHENANVYENLRIDSNTMIQGALKKDHDLVSMNGMLYEMCIMFQDQVYFNGMKKILDNCNARGASGQFGPVKVLCAEMCGYDRVMLQDANCYVVFQLRPGSDSMYVLGQDGTLPQIRNLVRTVVMMWNENPEVRSKFKSDGNVSVM